MSSRPFLFNLPGLSQVFDFAQSLDFELLTANVRRVITFFVVLFSTIFALILALRVFLLLRVVPPVPLPGRLVNIGGYHMHLHCSGEGPLLVLDAPLGLDSYYFSRVRSFFPSHRVCTYDRAGLGHSDAAIFPSLHLARPGDRYARRMAGELHLLLVDEARDHPFSSIAFVGHGVGCEVGKSLKRKWAGDQADARAAFWKGVGSFSLNCVNGYAPEHYAPLRNASTHLPLSSNAAGGLSPVEAETEQRWRWNYFFKMAGADLGASQFAYDSGLLGIKKEMAVDLGRGRPEALSARLVGQSQYWRAMIEELGLLRLSVEENLGVKVDAEVVTKAHGRMGAESEVFWRGVWREKGVTEVDGDEWSAVEHPEKWAEIVKTMLKK